MYCETFCHTWRVNSICLIFSHWRANLLYSTCSEYRWEYDSTFLPLSSLHYSSNGALLWTLPQWGEKNRKVKCWTVPINVSGFHENFLQSPPVSWIFSKGHIFNFYHHTHVCLNTAPYNENFSQTIRSQLLQFICLSWSCTIACGQTEHTQISCRCVHCLEI